MKACSQCATQKPESDFYRDRRASDGLHSECKSCHMKGADEWAKRNPEKRREIAMRSQQKHHAEYTVIKDAWRKRNMARVRAKRAEWDVRTADSRRSLVRGYKKAWKERHPEAVIANAQKRRAQRAGADGAYTEAEVRLLWKEQIGRCAHPWCQASLLEGCHRDHKIPLSRGGSNRIGNIQLLCPLCNTRKGRKTPEEFAAVITKGAPCA